MKGMLELYMSLVPSDNLGSHVRWMCEEILRHLDGVSARGFDDVGKLNRWIGFIQGYLWTEGLRTVDQMRADITNLQA